MLLLLGCILLLVLLPDRQPYTSLIKTQLRLFHFRIEYSHRWGDRFEVDVMDNILYISRYNKATHTKQEYLYSIFHEIGHMISHSYREYYDKFEEDELSSQAIYNEEVRAWRIARTLLESTDAYDKKIFDALRGRHLKDYRKALNLD